MLLLLHLLLQNKEDTDITHLHAPSAEEVQDARARAGVSETTFGSWIDLTDVSIRNYEVGKTRMDPWRWVYAQLATGIHPRLKVVINSESDPGSAGRQFLRDANLTAQIPSAEEVRHLREAADVSQATFAAAVGISNPANVSMYESGKLKMPRLRYLLAQLLFHKHPHVELTQKDEDRSAPVTVHYDQYGRDDRIEEIVEMASTVVEALRQNSIEIEAFQSQLDPQRYVYAPTHPFSKSQLSVIADALTTCEEYEIRPSFLTHANRGDTRALRLAVLSNHRNLVPAKDYRSGAKSTRDNKHRVGARPVRYKDNNGNSWALRGRMPQWLSSALKAGRTLSEFEIEYAKDGKKYVAGQGEKMPDWILAAIADGTLEKHERRISA